MDAKTPIALPVDEFCSKYRIHRSTFYRNLKKGLMPPIVKIGNSTRILSEDELAWLHQRKQHTLTA